MLLNTKHSDSGIQFWLKKVLENQQKRFFTGLFLAMLTVLSAIGLLALSGWLITATAISGLAIAAGSALMLDIYRPGGGIRFFALSRTVGRYFERLHNHDLVLRVIAGFRGTLFGGLLNLPVQQLRETRDSEWLSRLTADLDNLDSVLLRLLLPPLTVIGSVLLLALFISFFWLNLGLAFGVVTLLTATLYFTLFARQTSLISRFYAEQINHARLLTIEHLQGQLELQAAHLNQAHQTQLVAALGEIDQAQLKLTQQIANAQLIVSIGHGLLVTGVALAALWAYQHALFSGPVAVMLVLAVFGLGEILQNLPGQLGQWGKTCYAAERLRPLAEQQKADPVDLPQLERLSMMLAKHPKVSSSLDTALALVLTDAQWLIMTGRSGSGKSTVANILAGLELLDVCNSPYQLLINGIPLETQQTAAWHHQIGYLTQHNSILAATLASNLTLGLENVDEQQLWQVLALVELDNWAKQLPTGLHSWLGDTGSQLSGGQARRLCLARILLRNPRLILLDEPFNGIDDEMAQRIWQRVSPLWQDKMLIVMMHQRPDFFPEVDNQQFFEINLDQH